LVEPRLFLYFSSEYNPSSRYMKKPPKPTFWQRLWASLEPSLLILLKGIALFLTILAALVVGFAGVAGLKALGMRPERAEMIETKHFYA